MQDLIDNRVPVRLHLEDESELEGTIEFYDARFLRITRENQPNLFVYKHEIKYLFEVDPMNRNELAAELEDARGNQIGEPGE